jgi:hypothetical protein
MPIVSLAVDTTPVNATSEGASNRYDGVLPSGFSASLNALATCCKARDNAGGNSFPRLSARRRMPRHAFVLK